jgi:FdhD protein
VARALAAAVAPSVVTRWHRARGPESAADVLACEEPLEIRVQGRCLSVTMRTPGHDAELAAGFLLGEGLIRTREEIVEIAHCRLGPAASGQNILNVFLRPDAEVDFQRLTRHTFASSSCGLCGKASIDAVHQHFPPVTSEVTIAPAVLLRFPDALRSAQEAFDQTGGLHAAAVFQPDGRPIVVREDVGRHNAVDKAIGYGLLERQGPFDQHVLMVSGRASFEIMQKALAARIPIVAALSAPSSLAVEFARESGQTLIGFLRGNSMNVYAGDQRVDGLQ